MHLNPEQEQVWCHGCLRWHDVDTETILLSNGDVLCIYCDAHLGYRQDIDRWNEDNI